MLSDRDLFMWCCGIIAAHGVWRFWPEVYPFIAPGLIGLAMGWGIARLVRRLFRPARESE